MSDDLPAPGWPNNATRTLTSSSFSSSCRRRSVSSRRFMRGPVERCQRVATSWAYAATVCRPRLRLAVGGRDELAQWNRQPRPGEGWSHEQRDEDARCELEVGATRT